jgi:tetratricopeptide (TPR) repeat protein
MTQLEAAFKALSEARQHSTPAQLAQILIDHGASMLQMGYYEEAASAMDEAAELHRQLGNTVDIAICYLYSANAFRLLGSWESAENRAQRALQALPEDHPMTIPAWRELGEVAFGQGDGVTAADRFSKAIEKAQALDRPLDDAAMLLDRRARAFMLMGTHRDALADFQLAQRLYEQHGDLPAATKLALDQATLMHLNGMIAEAEQQAHIARQMAESNDNVLVLADICLLESAFALEHDDPDGALQSAWQAREFALQAVAPALYIAATLSIAELYDLADDHLRCYESLAVGYVTLADLLGRDMSNATILPKLQEKREKWGVDHFEAVKAAYEEQRKQ